VREGLVRVRAEPLPHGRGSDQKGRGSDQKGRGSDPKPETALEDEQLERSGSLAVAWP